MVVQGKALFGSNIIAARSACHQRFGGFDRSILYGLERWLYAALVGLLLFVSSCSAYVESHRPTPVEFDEFQPGRSRDSVIDSLGDPEDTNQSGGASCDLYHLY